MEAIALETNTMRDAVTTERELRRSALMDLLAREERDRPAPMMIDAALTSRGPNPFVVRRMPIDDLIRAWAKAIEADHLSDVRIDSLQRLTLDSRDGALCRGSGGLAYTPHAWLQLLGLMKAPGMPNNAANVTRWENPLTRAVFWAFDAVANSKRPSAGPKAEAVLRLFQARQDGRPFPAIRAVVSGIHGLADTDDSQVLAVIDAMVERPTEGRIYRGWDHTDGSFLLDSGKEDVSLAFGFRNSETGCGSLEFSGSLCIRALDAEVTLPDGRKYQQMVTVGTTQGRTSRRHTLPRFDTRTRRMFTPEQRTAIAAGRISTDIDKALAAARVMADRWEVAKGDVKEIVLNLSRIAIAEPDDEAPCAVLKDLLADQGLELLVEYVPQLVQIFGCNERLRALPEGSAAHFAGAIAVLAQGEGITWEKARELQRLAGRFVMDGWN